MCLCSFCNWLLMTKEHISLTFGSKEHLLTCYCYTSFIKTVTALYFMWHWLCNHMSVFRSNWIFYPFLIRSHLFPPKAICQLRLNNKGDVAMVLCWSYKWLFVHFSRLKIIVNDQDGRHIIQVGFNLMQKTILTECKWNILLHSCTTVSYTQYPHSSEWENWHFFFLNALFYLNGP